MRSLFLRLVAGLATAFALSMPASAQWAVFDASNFVKNTMTALQTAQQYAQLVQSYALQAQQFQNMVQNTQSLGAGVFSSAIGRQIASQGVDLSNPQAVSNAAGQLFNVYQNTANLMSTASQTFERAANFGADMNRMSAMTGLSWSDILQQDVQRAQAGQQMSAGLYNQASQINQSLGDLQTRSDAALQTAGSAQGAVQAIQGVALQNHVLSDQVSSLVTIAASGQQAQAVKDNQAFQEKQRSSQQAAAEYQAGLNFLQKLGNVK